MTLYSDQAAILLIDVQERLVQAMSRKDELLRNLEILLKGGNIFGMPVLWAEQHPKGLGPTVPALSALLPGQQPIIKRSFSCCGHEPFLQALNALQRKQMLVAGIETHVCVFQTALELHNLGYAVQVVSDAVSSRTPANNQIGLDRLRAEGITLTSTEMALFELLKVAEGAQFKEILTLVK